MTISHTGLALIEQFEGCRLTAYKCPAGILTVGVGHTSAAGLPKVVAGMTITHEEAMEILARDVGQFEAGVLKLAKVHLTQHQLDALTSFAFNLGLGALQKSTLLRKLNAGDIAGAADQFLVWNKAGGKVLTGLTRRRIAERALFLS